METADYGVLHAKRIMAVINLIAANGKMVRALPMEKVSALVAARVRYALHNPPYACVHSSRARASLCVYSLLVNTSPA